MRSGLLRKRVTIQEKRAPISAIVNTFGEETVAQDATWLDVGTFWGAVEPMNAFAREALDGRQEASAITTRIRIRHQGKTQVKPAMRAVMGDKRFDIEAVMNRDERDRELVLVCRESAAYGG